MASSNGNIFRVAGPLCGEFTGHRWIPLTKASDTELWCFRWFAHDDVIKWKHFPRYWPFVRGIHRSPVNYPHKGQWRGALMFTLICARINGWVNNRAAGDLRRYRAHYDVIVMTWINSWEKNGKAGDLRRLRAHYDVAVMQYDKTKLVVVSSSELYVLTHWGLTTSYDDISLGWYRLR